MAERNSHLSAGIPAEEPMIHVGIIDKKCAIEGMLNGEYLIDGSKPFSGRFTAEASSGVVVLSDETGKEIARVPELVLRANGNVSFTLFQVTIGNSFHWERKEDQAFQGDLIFKSRKDDTMTVINAVALEDYLKSVISSEMSGNAPSEFLMAHAVLSRSWLLAALRRKREVSKPSIHQVKDPGSKDELVRWYEQEDHELYDVCADDHCQRYQGITKIISSTAGDAVSQTRGQVLMWRNEICDARFSKACGGRTEDFSTAWETKRVSYLTSISDSPVVYHSIETEEEAARWINSYPEVYCNTRDETILNSILPGFDRETESFFRWKVEYTREELEEIILDKSGIDFGVLKEIKPLSRGPSGRIFRLGITGSKRRVVVGKELEIRRWLSRSHLYSSAFIVTTECNRQDEVERFIFSGAGWGHGVGLCQIGAAVMAHKGFKAGEILLHYFPVAQIRKIY